jgi:hypothetical protein
VRWRDGVSDLWVEEANHGDHSEPLTALVVEARTMLEHANTMQAQRVRAAAKAAAAAAVKAYVLCGRARGRLNLHVDGGVEEGGGEELRVALVEDAHGSRVLVRLQLVRRLERDAERRRMSGCTTMLYTCIPHPLLVPSAAEWQWELRGGELACALTTPAWNELAGRAAGQLAWRERAGAGAVCDAGREASESRAREMAYRGGPVLHVHPEVQRRVERPTQHGHIQRHVTAIVEPTQQLHLPTPCCSAIRNS